MRVCLVSDHRYPAFQATSGGLGPSLKSSGSAQHVHDLLARGLAQLGHEVFYHLPDGAVSPLPANVTLVTDSPPPVDIVHSVDPKLVTANPLGDTPWIATFHRDRTYADSIGLRAGRQWVFVSRTQAEGFGSDRFVYNGLDPDDYNYRQKKDGYFLYLSAMNWYREKGLRAALDLSREASIDLVVAGTSTQGRICHEVSRLCRRYGVEYVGDVRGAEKARLLAGARALIFPTQMNENCPLVIIESLLSGTPVITSDRAACREIVAPQVGFVCDNRSEYLEAVARVDETSPADCREFAMSKFHFSKMAEGYLEQYEREARLGASIAANGPPA